MSCQLLKDQDCASKKGGYQGCGFPSTHSRRFLHARFFASLPWTDSLAVLRLASVKLINIYCVSASFPLSATRDDSEPNPMLPFYTPKSVSHSFFSAQARAILAELLIDDRINLKIKSEINHIEIVGKKNLYLHAIKLCKKITVKNKIDVGAPRGISEVWRTTKGASLFIRCFF